jgi:hypothetical protein
MLLVAVTLKTTEIFVKRPASPVNSLADFTDSKVVYDVMAMCNLTNCHQHLQEDDQQSLEQ